MSEFKSYTHVITTVGRGGVSLEFSSFREPERGGGSPGARVTVEPRSSRCQERNHPLGSQHPKATRKVDFCQGIVHF